MAEARDDPRVKLFAGMLIREHGDADTEGIELARRLKLTLSDSDLSDEFTKDAPHGDAARHAPRRRLRSRVRQGTGARPPGGARAIDNKLLPNAKSSEVRPFSRRRGRGWNAAARLESIERSLEGSE